MIACRPSVCLSVTLVDCNHIGWKSWKLIPSFQLGTVTLAGWLVSRVCRVFVCPRYK